MRKLICGTYYQENIKLRLSQIGIKFVYVNNLDFYQNDYICVNALPKKLFDIVDLYHYDTISDDNHLLKYFHRSDLEKIQAMDDKYLAAAVIVRNVFANVVDKSGNPYINHLYAISLSDDLITSIAGLLHDIIEDTEITAIDLLEVGFSKEIVETVFIVTKPLSIDKENLSKDEKITAYNKEIDDVIASNNIHALKLKVNDMSNNYNEERLNMLPNELQNWFHQKYGNN